MMFQCANGRDDNRHVGAQTGLATLDINELLGTQIGSESCFSNDIVGELQCSLSGDDGVAAVRDVGERAAMHKCGIIFQRLYQIRF